MKRKNRIAATMGAGLLAATLTLTACSGGTTPGSSGATAWSLTGGTHEIIWKDSFASWSQKNPDQAISVEWFANDAYKEKIRTAIGSDNAPTLIFGWGGATLKDYVSANKVVDITDSTSRVLERLIPSIAEGGKIDGKVYGVPNIGTQPVVLYYNKDLFKEVGLDAPQTWDELLKAVEVFKAKGIIPISLAGASKWTNMMWLEYLFDRIGGSEVFDAIAAGESNAWSDPAVIEAATMVQDLVKAGAFGDAYGSVSADSNADVALVHTGKAAILLQGSWAYGTFLADAPNFVADGKLGFAPFPVITGGSGDPTAVVGNQSNFWSVAASASEKDQASATAYINSLFDDEYVKSMIDGGDIPPVLDAEELIAGSEQEEFISFGYDMVVNSSNFQLSWDQELDSATAQVLLDNIQDLFNLTITPQQFTDNLNATIK